MGPSFQYKAHVSRVIDGDTVVLDIDLGFHHWLHDEPIRLYGINAPEIRTEAGKKARTYLANYLPANIIVQTLQDDEDKYGRYLGILWVAGVNVNQRMIDKGHAVAWDGKGPRP